MPEVYLDACCIIYAVEGAPEWNRAIHRQLGELPNSVTLTTSSLSRLECRTKAVKLDDQTLLTTYEIVFGNMRLREISAAVIDRATEIRARYGFKTPDAIHLATAVESRAFLFLTGDERLERFTEVEVKVTRVGV
jgi:uncharacterized protein